MPSNPEPVLTRLRKINVAARVFRRVMKWCVPLSVILAAVEVGQGFGIPPGMTAVLVLMPTIVVPVAVAGLWIARRRIGVLVGEAEAAVSSLEGETSSPALEAEVLRAQETMCDPDPGSYCFS